MLHHSPQKVPGTFCAVAPVGLEEVLKDELKGRIVEQRGRLFLVSGDVPIYFAQNLWIEPKFQKIESISSGAKFLKGLQRNWALFSADHHRRAALIRDQLPPIKAKRIEPYSIVPTAPLGSWTLWDENTILYSQQCSSPFPNGEIEFVEDKENPPSRAYLKLWETFLHLGKWPVAEDKVMDLGSSPGGWTWVLDQLGCREVISVDKAPLAEDLKLSSRVKFLNESAFSLKPESVGEIDWLFSDIICYPEKLFELVNRWQQSGLVKNFVCTIKFQGSTDFEIIKKFTEIPGAKVRHLYHNKHELTFIMA